MVKISAFEKYEDTEIRHEQVVYLHSYWVDKYTIAQITGYTLSSINNLIRTCAHLLVNARKRFYVITQKALKEYRDKRIKDIAIAPNRLKAARHNNFVFLRAFKNYKQGNAFAYIFTFFDKDGKPQFLKIGKSERPQTRLTAELSSYRKSNKNISYAIVNKLILAPNGDRALTIENALREHYKKQSSDYLPKDRFLNATYDIDDLREDNFLKNTIRLCCMA